MRNFSYSNIAIISSRYRELNFVTTSAVVKTISVLKMPRANGAMLRLQCAEYCFKCVKYSHFQRPSQISCNTTHLVICRVQFAADPELVFRTCTPQTLPTGMLFVSVQVRVRFSLLSATLGLAADIFDVMRINNSAASEWQSGEFAHMSGTSCSRRFVKMLHAAVGRRLRSGVRGRPPACAAEYGRSVRQSTGGRRPNSMTTWGVVETRVYGYQRQLQQHRINGASRRLRRTS